MLDLKKLLVCDGKPSKEMIDYIVDSNIQKMVDEFAYTISQTSRPIRGNTIVEGYLNVESKHFLYTHFSVISYPQYTSEIINSVTKSVQRYEEFVKVKERPKDDDEKFTPRPNTPIPTEFSLTIEFTPEMKKMILLEQELPLNSPEKNRRPKV